MAKGAATQASGSRDSKRSSRTKRDLPQSGTQRVAEAAEVVESDSPHAVIHALADALRDILRDERRARAA